MSVCPKCGKEVPEGEVCSCMTEAQVPVTEAAPAAEAAPATEAAASTQDVKANIQDAAKKAESAVNGAVSKVADKIPGGAGDMLKKNGKYIGIAAAVVVVLLLLVVCFGGGGSYKDPINNIVKQVNKGKKADVIELQLASYPGKLKKVAKELLKATTPKDEIADFKEDMVEQYEDLEKKVKHWKVKFVYDDVKKMDKSDISDFQEEYEDYYDNYIEPMLDGFEEIADDDYETIEDLADRMDMDAKPLVKAFKNYEKYLKTFAKVKVTAGYKVKGHLELKDGSKQISKTDKVTLYVLKVNGEWVISSSKDNNRFHFDSSDKYYEKFSFLSSYFNNYYKNIVRSMAGMF